MSYDFVKHIAAGVFCVDVGRVDIASQHHEEVEISLAQGTHQARRLTRLDLIKGPIFDQVHTTMLPFSRAHMLL